MKPLAKIVVALALFVILATTAKADGTDVAELFPAETAAYLEIAHPAALSEEAAKLLAKSAFADSLKAVHDRFDKVEQPQDAAGVQRTALLALMLSPEMLAEVRKFRGIAIGITGFDSKHNPRYALVALFGESTAAGLAVRAYLTAGANVRRVGVVEGTPIYQHAGFNGPVNGPDGKPLPPEEGSGGTVLPPLAAEGTPTFAYRPGLLVIGSDATAVKETLRRASGKADGKSLAADAAFRKKRPPEKFAGAFVYSVPNALVKNIEPSAMPDWFEFAKVAFNWKTASCLSGTLTVRNDAVRFHANVELDKTTPNPFVNILSGQPASIADFQVAVKSSGWATTIGLPTQEKRTKAVLDLADTLAKGFGTLGRKPSEIVAEADRGPGAKLGTELIAGVRAATLVQPTGLKLPAEGQGIPMVVLHCETPAVAGAWVESGAKILGLIAGLETPPTRSSEQVGNLRIYSVAGAGLPGKLPIHFASTGDRVAFGQDRTLVAEALAGRGPEPRTIAMTAKPTLVGWVRPGSFFPEAKPPAKKPEPGAAPQPAGLPLPADVQPGPGGVQLDPPPLKQGEPLIHGLSKAFAPFPAIPFALATTADGVQFQFEIPDPAPSVCSALDRFLDWFAKQPVGNAQRGELFAPPAVLR